MFAETLLKNQSEESQLRIMAAKIIAQARWPYLSTLIFSLRVVESENLETLAVDAGWRMYYNPTFVMKQAPEVLATMVLHEALHCVFQHLTRFQALGQDPSASTTWNLAGDANINQVIDEAKMPWGEFDPVRFGGLSKYGVKNGMTTEITFFTMIKYFENHPEKESPTTDCGSINGGNSRSYEIPRTNSHNPAIKSDQQDVIRDRVAQDIIKHSRDTGISSLPSNLLRWARDLLEPQIDWRRALAGAMRTSLASVLGRKDYTFARPSRRQSAMARQDPEFILPSMRKPAPPTIAIVVDTSGSIGEDEINVFMSEIDGIVRANGISQGVTVIPCDAEVGEIQKLRSRNAIGTIKLNGGGGTDMGVGIAAAGNLRPTPKIVIVLTDGFTDWPEGLPKGVETLIACLTVAESMQTTPRWAKKILIEKDH